LRIGIFFGGPSREREVSFAGGRTVYDNLDKTLFEPVPIFVDSLGSLVFLDWSLVYKGTIRDFYPQGEIAAESKYSHYVESFYQGDEPEYLKGLEAIGRPLQWTELSQMIDFGFLALHGKFGEDGVIQSLLTNHGLPYSGSGILASSIGINKSVQKKWMDTAGFIMPRIFRVTRDQWLSNSDSLSTQIKNEFPSKMVIRPAHQGSSIGVAIIEEPSMADVKKAMNDAFFIQNWSGRDWRALTVEKREAYCQSLPDVKEGLGFPLQINGKTLTKVDEVITLLDQLDDDEVVTMCACDDESIVIVESFIDGREFSCIVVRDIQGDVIALPPTEIVKQGHLYDYRSKYLPGFSRKVTPIDLPEAAIEGIMAECERLFDFLEFGCYARIDGFYTSEEEIILNDPNTTSGMLPSSFFFHQAAEIGLNPSQFLTFIIHSSLVERQKENHVFKGINSVINQLSDLLEGKDVQTIEKEKIAVIFGGYSYERHISVESGRNIFEKLSSSSKYQPTPLFLQRSGRDFELVEIPINLLLKDNADDIKEKIENYSVHPIIQKIKESAKKITDRYTVNFIGEPRKVEWEDLTGRFNSVFIALHGRPGEDGAIQKKLDKLSVPYNGSGSSVSQITINKFDTLQFLGSQGFVVAEQMVVEKSDYLEDAGRWIDSVEGKFEYPFIAKPIDDGCSSAVMKINSRNELENYLKAIFRSEEKIAPKLREALNLDWNEEFPAKEEVLIEELITSNGAELFIEITCGLISKIENGQHQIQIFEPSEAIASSAILSLEEKFLAGQGMNITPARMATHNLGYKEIATQVKEDLKRATIALGISGYARIDAFVRVFSSGTIETIIIEVNSLPGMTPATCIYHQAALEGYKPYEFIDQIMSFAMQRAQNPVS